MRSDLCWDSVDPGVAYYARARWQGAELVAVAMAPVEKGEIAHLCVIEKPQVYKGSNVRNRDIEDLIFSAGLVAGRYPEHVEYLPAAWKGQVPKAVHHPRIFAKLTKSEQDLLSALPKKYLKHIMDAVGLGLHHLKQIGAR